MPFESVLWSVIFWFGGLTLGLGLRVLIFQASWALTGADDPPFHRVLIAVTPLWILAFVSGVLLDAFVFKLLGPQIGFATPRILGLLAVIAVASLIDLGVYVPLMRPSPRGTAFLALFEIVLTILAAVLVAAILFVVIAVVQVASRA